MAIKYRAIPTATESTLVLNSLQDFESGFYKCVLTNDCGTATTTAAELSVLNSDEYSMVYVSTFGELFDVCGISGAKTIILCPGTYTMNANLTVPENKDIWVLTGANIVTTGYTLTFPNIPHAGNFTFLSGTGTVSLPSVNPCWFGADKTGATSSSVAFQKAASASNRIIIPYGNYLFNYYVTFTSITGLEIIGEGGPTITLAADLDDASAYNTSFFKFLRCTNVTIKNINFDGQRDEYGTVHTSYTNADNHRFLWIVGCTDVKISNCNFVDSQGIPIKIVGDGATGGSSVAQIRSDATKAGVNGLYIENCKFDSTYGAIQINPSLSSNVHISKNIFDEIDIYVISVYPHTTGIYVHDNYFYDVCKIANNCCIRLYESDTGIVSGNYIKKCAYGIKIPYLGVDYATRDIAIRDNTIIDAAINGTTGFTGGGICVTGDRIDIEHNSIIESDTTPKYIAVELEGNNINFKNNYINYTPSAAGYTMRVGYDSGHGAGTYTNSNINICDNKILAPVSNLYGILLNAGVTITNLNESNNDISGFTNRFNDTNKVINHASVSGFSLESSKASANITASSSVTISVAIPSGVVLKAAILKVSSALTAGETWDASFATGSTTSLATAGAVTLGTQINKALVPEITTNTTNITITKNGGGSFTAQGQITALVYYEKFETTVNM